MRYNPRMSCVFLRKAMAMIVILVLYYAVVVFSGEPVLTDC